MDLSSLPLNFTKAVSSIHTDSKESIPSTIEQTERLFTTRSRNINYQTGGGDRGQHTFVQLITQDKSNLISRHTSEGMSHPTSLGTDTQGPLADAVNGKYGEFLLTDIRVSLDEKVQISEVIGDAEVLYYFGRQPINAQFQGVLIDSPDNNWFIQWVEMYAHVMRGTELARNYELIKIITPNMTFIGSLTNMNWSQNSSRDVDIPFGFTMLVKQIIPNAVMVPGKPTGTGQSINTDKLESFRTQSQIYGMKLKANTILNTVQNPFSTVSDLASSLNMNTVLSNSGVNPNLLNSISGLPGIDNITAGGGNTLPSITDLFGSSASSSGNSSTSALNIFSNVSSNLAGVRASLFSPVYGVLSSLTKLIKGVTGTVSSVINSFTNPVRNILRDIRNVSNQAVGVVNLINNSIDSITNNIRNVDSDLRATLATLKKTAGVISTAPQTITGHLRSLVNAGKLPATARFLQNNGNYITLTGTSNHTNKLFLLNSGPKHTPEQGAKL